MSVKHYSTGRRKTSVAKVWAKPGSGNIIVNGKSLVDYFKLVRFVKDARTPVELSDSTFDFDVVVSGGGISSQAGAVKNGIGTLVAAVMPDIKKVLKSAKCIAIDRRIVERKKVGLKKARKRPRFSKR